MTHPFELPKRSPTILLYGHSHTHAVQSAVLKRLDEQRPIPLTVYRYLKEKSGQILGNISFEGFLGLASQLGPSDVVLSMINGNHHAIVSMAQHPRAFDFFTPEDQPKANVEIIPYRALMQGFGTEILKSDGKQLLQLRKATKAQIVHLLPPPPKQDNDYIARMAGKVFAGRIRQGISPPELRLKFWQLQARVLGKWCERRGVGVLPPPAKAVENGFLRKKYWFPDATHANALYGELILRSVEQRFLDIPNPQG